MSQFKQYRRKGLSEMRPYVKGEDLSKISVSATDDPEGDMGMVARNPKDHNDQWYVARKYFEDNLEEVGANEAFQPSLSEVQQIKAMRQEGDALVQKIKAFSPSREVALSRTNAEQAVMWLGMELKRRNEPNPYPSSKDPKTGDVIEPTADGLKF